MGKEYPKGSLWFHDRLKNAFARNRDVQDEQKIRDLIKRGEYVVKVSLDCILFELENLQELEALYQLRKYRAMKSRYYNLTTTK